MSFDFPSLCQQKLFEFRMNQNFIFTWKNETICRSKKLLNSFDDDYWLTIQFIWESYVTVSKFKKKFWRSNVRLIVIIKIASGRVCNPIWTLSRNIKLIWLHIRFKGFGVIISILFWGTHIMNLFQIELMKKIISFHFQKVYCTL